MVVSKNGIVKTTYMQSFINVIHRITMVLIF